MAPEHLAPVRPSDERRRLQVEPDRRHVHVRVHIALPRLAERLARRDQRLGDADHGPVPGAQDALKVPPETDPEADLVGLALRREQRDGRRDGLEAPTWAVRHLEL